MSAVMPPEAPESGGSPNPSPPPEGVQASEDSLGAVFRTYVTRVRGGDVGSLPALLGLLTLVIVFWSIKPEQFMNSFNFANLITQAAAIIVLAMGLVFVLLLGEIDLSAGYTGGTSAAVMGVVLTRHDWNWVVSIGVCILTGAAIGLIMGLLVAKLGIPSFVVTLSFFLGLQGVMLLIIGEGGTIAFRDDHILAVMNNNLPLWLGWTLAIVTCVGYLAAMIWTRMGRRRAGLPAAPTALILVKLALLAVPLLVATYFLSQERSRNPEITSLKGVPIVVVVLGVLLVVLTYLLSRTAWGRHVYAVGGNAEAARRAGIKVNWVKISCFVMCSSLAAIAGILLVSRTNSVSPATGGATTLLYAVGAAVIGGTSLFGGRGRALDAVLGGLVIAVIDNGMLLLNQPAGRVYMVTGLVLLLAASVDAISRRRATASGLA